MDTTVGRAAPSSPRRRPLRGLLAAACALSWTWASAGAVLAEAKSDAESSYQAGVEQYAQGRFSQAQRRFEEALRLDPRHRAARVGLERIRVEHSLRELPSTLPAVRHGVTAARLRAEAAAAPFASLARLFFFERTVGDARSDLGRLEAMQGRIAQLEAERRLARSRGRAYDRLDELRALSRRLPSVVS